MKLYLLAVGINNYTAGVKRLSHCINDAKYWYDFIDRNYGDLIASKKLLTKLRETNAEVILEKLEFFLKEAKEDDNVIFIFSGHGDLNTRTNGDQIIHEQNIRARNRLISEKEISDLIKKTNKNVNLISIMDSCFSGGLEYKEVGISRVEDKVDIERVDGIELKTTSVEQNLDELKEDFKMLYEDIEDNTTKFNFFSQSLQGQNRILIAACEEFEQAYGIKNHHGLFTLRAKEVLERLGHTTLTYIDFIDGINATPLLTTEQNPRLIPRNSQWAHKTIFTHN